MKPFLTRLSHTRHLLTLVVFAFVLSFTLVVMQQQQEVRQRADVKLSNPNPTFYCLGLGTCNNFAAVDNPATQAGQKQATDSANPPGQCTAITISKPLTITPASIAPGGKLTASITFKNTCTVPYQTPTLLIAATDPNGKIATLILGSRTQLLAVDQEVTISGEITLTANAIPGAWQAFGASMDGNGNVVAVDSNRVPFTVTAPCAGLTVETPLALDKTTVARGETITGTITYKNPCTTDYIIHALLIGARNTNGSVADFITNGAGGAGAATGSAVQNPQTIPAGQTIAVTGSRTISPNDPLGVWKAFGSFQDMAGVWHSEKTTVPFTVVVASASANPPANPPAGGAAKGTAGSACKTTKIGDFLGGCTTGLTCQTALDHSTPCVRNNQCAGTCVQAPAQTGKACKTVPLVNGKSPAGYDSFYGNCGTKALICDTKVDNSAICKKNGTCSGTCQNTYPGAFPGEKCASASKTDWQGGCINGQKCGIKDTSATCKSTGVCSGTCVAN